MSIFIAAGNDNAKPQAEPVPAPAPAKAQPTSFFFCGESFIPKETVKKLAEVMGPIDKSYSMPSREAQNDVEFGFRQPNRSFDVVQFPNMDVKTKYFQNDSESSRLLEHVRLKILDTLANLEALVNAKSGGGVEFEPQCVDITFRKSFDVSNEDWHYDNSDSHSRVVVMVLTLPNVSTSFVHNVSLDTCTSTEWKDTETQECPAKFKDVLGAFTYFTNDICHRAPTMEQRGEGARTAVVIRFDWVRWDETGKDVLGAPRKEDELAALNELFS